MQNQLDSQQTPSQNLGLTSDYTSMSDQAIANRMYNNTDDLDEESQLFHDLGLGNRQ